jgi:diguanylate cyclase (GGDEF)-like protein
MSVRVAATIIGVAVLLAVIGLTTVIRATADRHADAQRRADRAIANTGLYQQAISSAYDEWVMVTGYFVTGDEAYIERFRASRRDADAALEQLIDDARKNEPEKAAQLEGYISTHRRFSAAEEQVIDAIVSGDFSNAISIAVDTDLTVESAAFLADLKREIDAQQDRLRDVQGQQEHAVADTVRWSLAIAAFCLALMTALGFASYHWIGKSLSRASLATRSIASGDLTARVPRIGPRELADLASDVNSMAEALIRRSDELNAYLSQNLEARTQELERLNLDLEREAEEHRRTSESLRIALDAERELEQQLRHQASHDPLTKIANRARFLDRLEYAAERSARANKRLAVLFLDIDDFKGVNDSLGHQAGDLLLQEMAVRVTRSLRPGEIAARIGGDEFAVLIDEVTESEDASTAAGRILSALRPPIQLGVHEIFVRASIGVAIGDSTDAPEEIIRRADVAMYAVKGRGKNGHALYDPDMEANVGSGLAIAGELQRALEREEFALYYQPSIRLADSTVAGVEALVRWNHPTKGVLEPQTFIGVAESTGIIVPLGRWVLQESCRTLRRWQAAFPEAARLTVSVNVSAAQVQHAGFVEVVREALLVSGLAPKSLILEITESVMMQNVEHSVAMLNELKSLGVRLAIDDFGTGYSSLSYLRRFPVDILKIDKSFVDGLSHAGKEQEIAQSIIELGRSLDMELVAEGVERIEQLGWLRARKCDMVQGYFFSRPVPPAEIEDLLEPPASRQSA